MRGIFNIWSLPLAPPACVAVCLLVLRATPKEYMLWLWAIMANFLMLMSAPMLLLAGVGVLIWGLVAKKPFESSMGAVFILTALTLAASCYLFFFGLSWTIR